ncbi:MAG TPA: PaaI family thioesterase [Ktedonobacteraceae bacterium]
MDTPANQPELDKTLPSGAEIIRQFLPLSPFVGHLGIQLVDMQNDQATLKLPFTSSLVTIGQTVHGGALASLIDTTAMVAAWSGAGALENPRGTTVGLTVSYLAAAQGEDVSATAHVLRRGRSLVYLDVEVESASGTLVAKGLVTYKLG